MRAADCGYDRSFLVVFLIPDRTLQSMRLIISISPPFLVRGSTDAYSNAVALVRANTILGDLSTAAKWNATAATIAADFERLLWDEEK